MQLKEKVRYLFETYKQSISSQKFILIFLLLFVLSIYGVFGIANSFQNISDYITGFLLIILNNNYVTFLLLIIMINTINIYEVFSHNYNYIIRLGHYKEYLIVLIENILFSNIMLLIINFLLIMIGLNIFNPLDFLVRYNYYNLLGIIYLVYAIIRFSILANIMATMYILLSKIANNKIAGLVIILVCISIFFVSYDGGIIVSSLKNMPLLIGYYFVSIRYGSFLIEILFLILYIIFLVSIEIILFKRAIVSMRSVEK